MASCLSILLLLLVSSQSPAPAFSASVASAGRSDDATIAPAPPSCTARGVRFHGRGVRIADDLFADCDEDGAPRCYRVGAAGKTLVPCEEAASPSERASREPLAASNGTQQHVRCRVGDVEFDGLSHYLVGEMRRPGSVFADCAKGVATCFEDDGVADSASRRIPCDGAELAARRRRLGVYTAGQGATAWPHRVVCVRWQASFRQDVKEIWYRAFQEYLVKTGIHFVSFLDCRARFGAKTTVCNDCQTYVSFTAQSSGCSASVGFFTDSPHVLDVGGADCANIGTFLHELGHVVGLYHEHAHPEREVIVLRDQMSSISSNNYAIAKRDEIATTKYERRSVMHYDANALCVPKNPKLRYCDVTETAANGCVEPTPKHCDPKQQSTFGKTDTLTPQDVATILKMYEKVPRHPNAPAPRSRSFRGAAFDASGDSSSWGVDEDLA
ncbi:hypothetical protein ATCC90586_000310 [Pythium insidiosum]|nr:hypothetical protein ATCC90586_000310 [Pythium insidiosum]